MGGKIAFVLGGADTVWSDLAKAEALAKPDLMVACNHAARDVDRPLDCWATMHPDLLPLWIGQRKAKGYPDAGEFWTAGHRHSPIEINRLTTPGGSSGLLSAMVALEKGADKVILCGIPMHQHNRHYDRRLPWREANLYHSAWLNYLPKLEGRVKSFNGYTAQWLGTPTEEWIHGDDQGTAG